MTHSLGVLGDRRIEVPNCIARIDHVDIGEGERRGVVGKNIDVLPAGPARFAKVLV